MSEAMQFTSLRGVKPRLVEDDRLGGVLNVAVSQAMDRRIEALMALKKPLLKALARAGHTHSVQDVADMIARDAVQFFGNERGACITEVINYPRRRVLNCWLTFGELEACLALQPAMEAYARECGCNALVATGREGWLPALEKQNWRRFGFVMARELG